jgi:Ca2+-binding RTX toxin-like protein
VHLYAGKRRSVQYVTVDLAAGTGVLNGSPTRADHWPPYISALVGSQFDDTLRGDDTGTLLIGLNGADTILGGSDPDMILGNRGNDRIRGRGGNDNLGGGKGNDHLDAGPGSYFCARSMCPSGAPNDEVLQQQLTV